MQNNIELERLKSELKEAREKLEIAGREVAEQRRKAEMLEFQLRQYLLSDGYSIIRAADFELTNKESMVLACLESGLVTVRSEILGKVWGTAGVDDRYFYSRSLDVYVSKLRKILDGSGYSIKTIHGKGFQLIKN
jgi:DNA-binding winged helix-turn-helix (wHTH) protein